MGFELHHGVRNTPWGEKCKRWGIKEGVCVYAILYWLANATREALKAMVGQASLPAPLCGPSSPNAHATEREGQGEGSLLLVPRRASLFSMSMAVVVGRFVSLAFIAFFLGRTSTPQEEE